MGLMTLQIKPHTCLGTLRDASGGFVSGLAQESGQHSVLWLAKTSAAAIQLDLESAKQLRAILDAFVAMGETPAA